MGKVQFPLVNIRKDVLNNWHLEHILSEVVHVPNSPNEWGYYTVYLSEIPDNGSSNRVETCSPKIANMLECRTDPVNYRTGNLNLLPNQFYVNYTTGELMFHPAMAGQNLSVDYYAKGSLIEADDINYLYNRVIAVETTQNMSQFTSFEIEDFDPILELGTPFPTGSGTTVPLKFKWELENTHLLKEDSISIYSGTVEEASEIPLTQREAIVDIHKVQSLDIPSALEISIHAEALNGQDVSKSFNVQWVDRVYFGVSDDKTATQQSVESMSSFLLPSSEKTQKIEIEFPEFESRYKMAVLPRRYSIKSIKDKNTGLDIVLSEPFDFGIRGIGNIAIPCYAYFTEYKISSAFTAVVELGEGE